jgi:hypothetical protein
MMQRIMPSERVQRRIDDLLDQTDALCVGPGLAGGPGDGGRGTYC